MKLQGSLELKINDNILLKINDEGILINDFSQNSHVIVTGGKKMDMIHHNNVHTLFFEFKKEEKND